MVNATTVVGMPSTRAQADAGNFDDLAQFGAARRRRVRSAALVSVESPTRRIMMSAGPRRRSRWARGRRRACRYSACSGPSSSSTGSGMRRISRERVEQFVDGGIAQLGIGGVRHLAGGADFVAQRALAAERELVLGGLAVDDVARAARRLRRPCRRRRCCAPRRPRTAGRNRAGPLPAALRPP